MLILFMQLSMWLCNDWLIWYKIQSFHILKMRPTIQLFSKVSYRRFYHIYHTFSTSCEIALWEMLPNTFGSTNKATSPYLSKCWYRSMSPCGFTRPHWVRACHDDGHGNGFPLWRESIGHQWFPSQRTFKADHWCIQQTVQLPEIRDAKPYKYLLLCSKNNIMEENNTPIVN